MKWVIQYAKIYKKHLIWTCWSRHSPNFYPISEIYECIFKVKSYYRYQISFNLLDKEQVVMIGLV